MRLLAANSDDPDCPKDIMQSLGVSILASFASNPELVERTELRKSVPHILNILSNVESTAGNSIMVTDCLQLVTALADTDDGAKVLLRHPTVEIICKVYEKLDSQSHHEMVIFILTKLLQEDPEYWEHSSDSLINFLKLISSDIKTDQSENKFSLIQSLNACISSMPTSCTEQFNQLWIENVASSLCDIFTSRVGPAQRNPALSLSATLTNLYQLNWTTKTDQDKKLSVLLVRLACVEIRMLVYDWDNSSSDAAQEVLLTCFTIIEACCSHIAQFDQVEDENELFTFEEIKSLDAPLTDAIKSIEILMTKFMETKTPTLLIACLRTVSSWLNVEMYATSELGIAIAPTFLTALKVCMKEHLDDILKAASPGILNYAENASSRNAILESGIIEIFGQILVDSESNVSEETSCLVSQCLMVLCLESGEKDCFISMLKSFMEYFISIPKTTALAFYIGTLTLIVWNLEISHSLVEQERFFKTLVSFLHNVHKVGEAGIEISSSYKSMWASVEQLWPIIMKEFIRCLKTEAWIKELVLESGIQRKVKNLISKHNSDLEGETQTCYGLLNAVLEA
ncbi:neurochondrin [Ciona intestinalis]